MEPLIRELSHYHLATRPWNVNDRLKLRENQRFEIAMTV
jgi:hypothetical protein